MIKKEIFYLPIDITGKTSHYTKSSRYTCYPAHVPDITGEIIKMNNDDYYQPISCDLYSEYELAIIRGHKIKLVWQENQQTSIATVTPIDLLTRDHQEFLKAVDHAGDQLQIRLDHIRSQTFITA